MRRCLSHFSHFNPTTDYDDAKYDATTYDGPIWNGDANDATTIYTNDATSNDATKAIVSSCCGCNIKRWTTSYGTETNISGIQVTCCFPHNSNYLDEF